MDTGVRRAGFTIIEVILFLAVSSALTIAILATATVNINNQRYIDAVRSFRALLQEQYINVTRVQNPDDGTDPVCPGGATGPRGTNTCLLIGKLVSVSGPPTGGNTITIRNIVGTPPANEQYDGPDMVDIKKMLVGSIVATDKASETLEPQWSTTLYTPPAPSASSSNFNLIILRAPGTGTLYTFFTNTNIIAPSTALDTYIRTFVEPPDNVSTICVNPEGLTFQRPTKIMIYHKATGPNAIVQGDTLCP